MPSDVIIHTLVWWIYNAAPYISDARRWDVNKHASFIFLVILKCSCTSAFLRNYKLDILGVLLLV